MREKITAYILLAITFGYVLTSVVPSTLLPEEELSFALKENSATMEEEIPSEVDDPVSTLNTQGERSIATESRKGSQVFQDIWQYSVWVFDLLLALIVYFVARRRFV
jgi:hypothetical protein